MNATPDYRFADQLYAGARACLSAVISVGAYSVVWGVLARGAGMTLLEVVLMSGLAFAGSTQFVALGLWTPTPSILPIGPMANAVDPAQGFDINMDHLARARLLVTDHRRTRLQPIWPVQAKPAQDQSDAGARQTQRPGNGQAALTLTAQPLHRPNNRRTRRYGQRRGAELRSANARSPAR